MASSPAELLYDFISHLSQQGAAHIGKRMDKAAGLQPPQPYQMPPFQPPPFPAMPTMPGMAPMASIPALVPATAMATGAVVAADTKKSPEATTDTRDAVTGSYSDQVAQGIACLACTRGHLNGTLAAIESAQKAMAAGDDQAARKHYAMAAAEIDAMVTIDWAPEKLAMTPEADVAIIESVRDCVMEIRHKIPTPEAISLALGSAKENVRFAISPNFTDRDKAEIEERLRIIDKQGNALERGALLDVDDAESEQAATALRNARHTLDDAKAHDALYAVKTHKRTVKDLEAAAIALTPTPDADHLDAVGQLCQSCSDVFYQAYFLRGGTEAIPTRSETPSMAIDPLDPTAKKIAPTVAEFAHELGMTEPIQLTTNTQKAIAVSGHTPEEFAQAWGYTQYPTAGGDPALIWIDAKQPQHELHDTIWHELLHLKYPDKSESEIDALAAEYSGLATATPKNGGVKA